MIDDVYRVLVIRNGGLMGGGEVLFEAASPDAGRLLAYAPDEVEAALTAAGYADVPQKVTGVIVTEAPTIGIPSEADAMSEAITEDPPAPKTRRRRTKAEIEADKAAAAALATGGTVPEIAPPVAVGESSPPTEPNVVAETLAAGVPLDQPEMPGPVTVPAAAPPAGTAQAPAAPWNPFMQQG